MTVLAVAIVWVALVTPYQPRDFHLVDFLRVPLELIIVAGVALLLPKNPRRVFAILAGVLLAVALVLKAINYETYSSLTGRSTRSVTSPRSTTRFSRSEPQLAGRDEWVIGASCRFRHRGRGDVVSMCG